MTQNSTIIQKLIDDEIEAIDGYNQALKTINNDVLKKIRDEEMKHIEMLKELLVFGG